MAVIFTYSNINILLQREGLYQFWWNPPERENSGLKKTIRQWRFFQTWIFSLALEGFTLKKACGTKFPFGTKCFFHSNQMRLQPNLICSKLMIIHSLCRRIFILCAPINRIVIFKFQFNPTFLSLFIKNIPLFLFMQSIYGKTQPQKMHPCLIS